MNARTTTLLSLLLAGGCANHASGFIPSQTLAPQAHRTMTPAAARAQTIFFAGYDASKQPYGTPELGAYGATANGNFIAPRRIAGSMTTLINPTSMAIDSTGRLWTCEAFYDRIVAFPTGAKGNVAPVVTIGGSKVPLDECGGMTLAGNGDIFATSYGPQHVDNSAILIWKAGSNGNVAPTHAYRGNNTALSNPLAIAVDSSRIVHVSNIGTQSLATFASTPGNVSPTAQVMGTNAHLSDPYSMALSADGTKVYVGNLYGKSVAAFSSTANGDKAPMFKISGTLTKIVNPNAVAVDAAGYVYVGTCPEQAPYRAAILVFAPGASGNVAPIQTIGGDKANLSCISGLTVR